MSAQRSPLLISLVGCCLAASSTASGDVVRLVNGGQVRGQVDPASQADDSPVIVVHTPSGGTVVLPRADVEFVEPRSPLVEEYETRARAVADTVEAHWDLAEWCRENRLQDQRSEQLELLLDLDPEHSDARRVLGHVRHNGEWMTRDEWMTSRGYVKHRGKWITEPELDLLLKSDAEREAETAWYPQVRIWSGWITGRNPQRAAEGHARLVAIDDPDAVPALVNFLGDEESDNLRLLCVQLLGKLDGPKPVKPLVRRSLFDEDEDVRLQARAGIEAEQYELALQHYVPELKHDSNQVVQRAAGAIAEMGDMTVVPYLIEALVTTHKWKVQVPAGSSVFGTTPDGRVGMSSSGLLPPEVEVLARSGQLPYGAIVIPPPFQQRTRTVTIKGDVKNAAVLAALQKITGQDFGYDKRGWQVWFQTQAST